MDALDRDQVERAARLSRLRLEEGDVETLARELAAVLAHLEEVRRRADPGGGGPAGGEAPGPHPEADSSGALRPDEVGADELGISPGAMAPEWREGHFVVPRLPRLDRGPDAGGPPEGDGGAR